jgi:hypothetical protein
MEPTTLSLAVRRSNYSARSHPHSARSHPHSARSHPHSAGSHPQFHTRLDLIHTRLDLNIHRQFFPLESLKELSRELSQFLEVLQFSIEIKV